MSNDPTREEPPAFDAPPPPPAESPDEAEDMGLATERVFSDQRRQQLRDNRAYETLATEDATSDDDEDFYEDVTANDDATDEHSTELLLTEDHAALREAVQQAAPEGTARNSASAGQMHQSFGTSGPRSFDPKQYYSQQTGSSNQSFALLMLIILSVVALGIFGVLGLLIYRITMGA